MTWRERFGRATRPVVRSIARVVRGDSEEEIPLPASVQSAETDVPAVPPWGLLPSQVPLRVELLRGQSSVEILKGAWGSAIHVSVVVAVVGTLILLGRDDIPLFWIVPITLLAGGAVRTFRSYRAAARMREEHRAGYTVWRRKAPQHPQVDGLTGYEIRAAGAPQLTKQQQIAAVKRVRDINRFVQNQPRAAPGV